MTKFSAAREQSHATQAREMKYTLHCLPMASARGAKNKHAKQKSCADVRVRAKRPKFSVQIHRISWTFRISGLIQLPLIEIAQAIERLAAPLQVETIYTHSVGDLNLDHRLTCAAVLTAFRPVRGQSVSAIYGFEILSSTEWNFGASNVAFQPTRFVCISDVLRHKIEALEAYSEEMRDFPHPRSYDAVRALAALRGATVGVEAAEAFSVLREVVR